MSDWKVILPETTQNQVKNPSFEAGTTDWVASGTNTIAQSSDRAFAGVYSLKCTYQSSTTMASNTAIVLPTTSTTYTITAWVYVPSADWGAIDLILFASNMTGSSYTTIVRFDASEDDFDTWKRIEAELDVATDVSGSIGVAASGGTPSAGDFIYLDAVQVEEKTYPTTYCDGDQEGCEWDGAVHASTSTRKHWSTGGRVRDFADDLSFTVHRAQGIGMPPVESGVRALAGRDGGLYDFTRTAARLMTLAGHVKGTSKSNMHALIQGVIDALGPRKPRAAYGPVLRRLRYTAGAVDKEIDAFYDAGLELDVGVEVLHNFGARLIAPDPYWYGTGDRAAVLNTSAALTLKYVAAREGGVWNGLGPPSGVGTLVSIDAITRGPDGTIYVGGQFTNWDGDANADYAASWDGTAWSPMATGPGGEVEALLVAPDGTLYAGMGSTGGVQAWNGSSWSAVGALSDNALDLALGTDGTLYAGTDAGEVQAWDGSSWSAVGTIGSFTTCRAVAVAPDGTLYAAVDSTVKAWDGSSWTTLGSAFGNTPLVLAVTPDGTLYAGGVFSTSYNYIAAWNGTAWESLATGTDGNVRALAVTDSGRLYVGGSFDNVGDLAAPEGLAIWDGSRWLRPDITQPSASVYDIDTYGESVYIVTTADGSASIADETTVSNTDDAGSSNLAPVYPVIEIERSGGTGATIKSVINETTGAELWFDYDLLDGETVTVDLRPGQRRMVSDYFGERWRILPQSDVASWQLLAGDNQVMTFVSESGSPTITATIRWRPRYWSAD